MQLFDLTGRVAIVTGGNGGIGLGMARGLATAGAAIVVAARDERKSAEAVRELEGLGAEAMAVRVDVTEEASCRAMVQATLDRFGRLDVLVNNAGTNVRKQPQEYTLEEWHLILETNLTSAFACSQAAYPAMRQAGRGKIIMIDLWRLVHGALCRDHRRHRAARQGARLRLGQGQHPGQRRAAGLDRFGAHASGAPRHRGPGGAGDRAHARRPLGGA